MGLAEARQPRLSLPSTLTVKEGFPTLSFFFPFFSLFFLSAPSFAHRSNQFLQSIDAIDSALTVLGNSKKPRDALLRVPGQAQIIRGPFAFPSTRNCLTVQKRTATAHNQNSDIFVFVSQ